MNWIWLNRILKMISILSISISIKSYSNNRVIFKNYQSFPYYQYSCICRDSTKQIKIFYIEDFNLFRTVSTDARILVIGKGLIIFKDHPVVGVGFNTYRYAQYRYHFENPVQPNLVHDASGNDNR